VAAWQQRAGVESLLVGDSMGTTVLGQGDTLGVTMDLSVTLTAAVRLGAPLVYLVADMPFMSYQASVDEAVKNAGRLMAEGGAESVKLEGGADYAEVVSRIVRAGIPVMGHIGLTPQSVHALGGYVVQGKTDAAAEKLLADAKALEAAGIYALVLEAVPTEVAARITEALSIPTIGIGAGVGCDGQVLVCYDLFGFNPDFKPKFVKRFADGYQTLKGAVETYATEVRGGSFPDDAHSFHKPQAVRAVEDDPGKMYGSVAGK